MQMKLFRKHRKRVVEVDDLSFLSDRNHRYNWLQRHYYHRKLKRRLRKAATIVARNEKVATDLHRYYFVPMSRVTLKSSESASDNT